MLSVSLAVLMSGFMAVIIYILVNGMTMRTLLGDSDAALDNPLGAHAQRGWRFCAEFRLGPAHEWWRYFVPLTLGERSKYRDTSVS